MRRGAATLRSVPAQPAETTTAEPSAIDGFQIIYFGNDWRAENRTSSHHIARRLADRVPVLYVETPGSRAPQATGRDLRKLWAKLTATFSAPRPVGPRMWVITVPQVPFGNGRAVAFVNRVLSILLIRRAQRQLGFTQTISWFVVPHVADLAGRLGEHKVVYYCIDDYAAFPHVDRAKVERQDASLTQRADQVFVASPKLLDKKRRLNPTAVYSPHGVDFDHFKRASDPDFAVAPLLQSMHLRQPVIGFFGLIETWIDLDLIDYLANARPEWTFLLIGRVAVDVTALQARSNVYFVGPQPYEMLPAWARAFDVAIIPYRKTQQVFNANPLKLREYLATGKPVVAVHTPEIETFASHVRIADDPDAFLAQVELALQQRGDAVQRLARMQSVAAMSWDDRVRQVLRVVAERVGPGARDDLRRLRAAGRRAVPPSDGE